MQQTKAVITLTLLSPVLAELLSGSSPAFKFFNPPYLLLQLVSYGLPVLVIRELSVKWKLGLYGIFILGLAYGVFNEGLLAHTFLTATHTNGYGFYLGLNLAWMPLIIVWHALHSILYPILIIYFLFPEIQNQPWLSDTSVKALVIIAVLESILLYFAPHQFPAIYFVIFWLAIFALFAYGKRKAGSIEILKTVRSYRAVLLGFISAIIFLVATALSKPQIILLVYWAILGLMIFSAALLLKKLRLLSMPGIIYFIVGDYISYAIFAMFTRSPQIIFVNLLLILFLLALLRQNRIYTYNLKSI